MLRTFLASHHRQEIAIMRFEYTRLPQEEDLTPDNTHGMESCAVRSDLTGRVYYSVSSEFLLTN